MATRTTVLDGEDTEPLEITRDSEMNVSDDEQGNPQPLSDQEKDDLMQDEEDTDGNV